MLSNECGARALARAIVALARDCAVKDEAALPAARRDGRRTAMQSRGSLVNPHCRAKLRFGNKTNLTTVAALKTTGSKLAEVKEIPFRLERELRRLTEANLGALFGLEFVTSEFERDGLRIDTLAFDPDARSFVIIEYKKDQSFSVVDQGFAYLSLMLKNKEVFLVEYNERRAQHLKRGEIDWSQSKVIFIARAFTQYQQAASGFKDLPIELWKVTRYDGDLVHFDPIESQKTSASVKTLRPGKRAEEVVEQVKTYNENDVLPASGKVRELYDELKERLTKLDTQLIVHVRKTSVAYRVADNWRNIFAIHFRASKLRIELMRTKTGDLNDPENKVVYIEDSIRHWNQHISQFEVGSVPELDYAVYLLQQAIERFKREHVRL